MDGNTSHNNPNFGTYKSGQSEIAVVVQWPAAKSIATFGARGWTDRGMIDDGSSFTLYLYCASSAPTVGTVGTYGTLLGSQGFTESSPGDNTLRSVTSSDQSTTCAYTVLRIVKTDGTGFALGEISGTEGTGGGGSPPPSSSERPFAIIFLDGQSNAVGAATPPSQTIYANRARIYNFALDGTIKAAVEPLMDTTGSLWSAFNNTTIGASPVMSMANALLDRIDNFDILICVSAKGSTSHYDWAKGGSLYTAMLDRDAAAIAAATAARPGSFVLAKVMYQAESSTGSTSDATSWKTTLPTRVADRRADRGLPDLPVLIAGLGKDPTGANATNAPAWPQLRLDQMTMDLPAGVFYVGISDMPSGTTSDIGADITNTDTVVEFGKRWAAALWNRLPDYVRRIL